MNKVYVVLHKRVEAGESDDFKVKGVFLDKAAADKKVAELEATIDKDYNDEEGVVEEYWVEEHQVA